MARLQGQDEARTVVAECIGRLGGLAPALMLPHLTAHLLGTDSKDTGAEHAMMREVAVLAVRHMLQDSKNAEGLREALAGGMTTVLGGPG